MGNHEFNAISFATPDPETPGEFMRPHNKKNRKQHKEFTDADPGQHPLVRLMDQVVQDAPALARSRRDPSRPRLLEQTPDRQGRTSGCRPERRCRTEFVVRANRKGTPGTPGHRGAAQRSRAESRPSTGSRASGTKATTFETRHASAGGTPTGEPSVSWPKSHRMRRPNTVASTHRSPMTPVRKRQSTTTATRCLSFTATTGARESRQGRGLDQQHRLCRLQCRKGWASCGLPVE